MSTEGQAAPAAEVVTPAPGAAAPETAAPEAQQPEKTFTQKELDEILEKRLAKERRKRSEKEEEIRVLRRLALDRGEAPPKKETPAPSEDREPVRGDFEDYAEFNAALSSYRAGKTTKAILQKDKEDSAEKQRQEEARKAGETFRSRLKENAKGIEDFDDVMAGISPDSAVAKLPADPINAADNPAKILHHLATHPEEAERIASLPMGQQAREIWKLDATLSATKPPEKKPSAAPAPINPIGGGKSTPAGEMPDPNTDQKGWMAWRNSQVRAGKAKPA